ncbi:MAG: pyruvate, water dikinase regulatory protein [Moorellales bacterium]
MPTVFVVSDSLGETAEYVVRAAASQFDSGRIEVRRVPYVAEEGQLEVVVAEAARSRPSIIAYTLVVENLKRRLVTLAEEKGVPAVDVLGPVIEALARAADLTPRGEPGLLRRLDEEYYGKMEAIEFAVRYDDGKDPRGLLFADVVLIGVSRTSKTPVSMYLAHKRIKAANLPLVPEVAPCEELWALPRHKIVGLTIDPHHLYHIRQERLKSLGLVVEAGYASLDRIYRELEYAHSLMERLGCPVIDVTNRAVEETAGRIIEIYRRGQRHVC